jgi:hypothetical protein
MKVSFEQRRVTLNFLDLNTPAMTLYLPSELAATRFRLPSGSYYNAFKTEMALQMKLNDKLLYQGMAFDGTVAHLVFSSVTRSKDILVKHRTDIGAARYLMPKHRDGFVGDMVRLVRCMKVRATLTPCCSLTRITAMFSVLPSRLLIGSHQSVRMAESSRIVDDLLFER